MKKFFLTIASVVSFSVNSLAANYDFVACSSYNKDARVQLSVQNDKLIDFTVFYLTEGGQPAQTLFKTKVTQAAPIPAQALTPDVVAFLQKYGVNDATDGIAYDSVSEAGVAQKFGFDILNQKGNGRAVLAYFNDQLIFIGSTHNCK